MPRHVWSSVLDFFYRCAGCFLRSHITPCSAAKTQLLKREVKATEKPAHHRGQEKGCQDHERHQPPCSLARCPFALVQEVAEPPVLKHQLKEQLFSLLLYDFRICWCSVVLLSSAVWLSARHQDISNHWMCVINPKFSSTSFIFRVMRGVYCTPL